MNPKQEAADIEKAAVDYCASPTTLPTEKAECEFILPLKGLLSKPISRGHAIDTLQMCQRMSRSNKSVCGKVKYKNHKCPKGIKLC